MAERQIRHGDDRLPMTMQARVEHGQALEPEPASPDAPGMIRIPVTIHLSLPDLP